MPHPTREPAAPESKPIAASEPDGSVAPKPIGELAGRADFPQCALGVFIDIHGFAGVVVEIVRDSIRVRSPDGITQRFNANRLRILHAPAVRARSVPEGPTVDGSKADSASGLEEPKPSAPGEPGPSASPRHSVADPDFTAPVRAIREYAGRSDFPECAYGKHVDIRGFEGVVVELVHGSLKVQSSGGVTRTYNADTLRKLYGRG